MADRIRRLPHKGIARRLTVSLSPEDDVRFDRIKAAIRRGSSDTFNNALALYDWFLTEEAAGAQVLVVRDGISRTVRLFAGILVEEKKAPPS